MSRGGRRVEAGKWRVHAGDLSHFGRLATVETHRRGTETAGTVRAVLDGAEWQQGYVALHCPDLVRILDFLHAAGYVAAAGQAALGPGEASAEWLVERLHELTHRVEVPALETLAGLRAAVHAQTAARRAARRQSAVAPAEPPPPVIEATPPGVEPTPIGPVEPDARPTAAAAPGGPDNQLAGPPRPARPASTRRPALNHPWRRPFLPAAQHQRAAS